MYQKRAYVAWLVSLPQAIVAAVCLLSAAQTSAKEATSPPSSLNMETQATCVQWLRENGSEPGQYIVSKFAAHDLVMLGELHEVKDNCEFVASLVPSLYMAGIRTLCSEFLCSRHNCRLAEIVIAKTYDEASVRDLFRSGPWPTWGYKEYMDIVRSIWAFNQTLSPGQEPFRILGIDDDWKQIDILTKAPAERMKIVLAREQHMISVIEKEVFERKRKALVHIGFSHTVRQGKRVAAQLARTQGKRLFQVCLHHEMPGAGGPSQFTSFIETMISSAEVKSVGFDVAGTPFGLLRDDKGQYFQMLGRNSTFMDFAEGYVFLKPARELKPVSWVTGFIVPETFEEARTVSEGLRWVGKGSCSDPKALDDALAQRLLKRQKRRPVTSQ